MPSAEWVSQPGAQGQLCDLRVSPDGKWAALDICATEGVIFDVYIINIATGAVVRANLSDATDLRLSPYIKPTWFRGWFPDSRRVLLMSDWLEIRDIETNESRIVTPKNETVTDAAVSPDGQKIAYTLIQGDGLKIMDTAGNLLYEIPAPSPKPGDRPEGITWSSDDRFIAYIWDQTVIQFNSYGPLWVVDAQTGKQWPLSPDKVFDGSPVWSPQGDQILVVRRENMEDQSAHFELNKLVSSLWVADMNTQAWHQLTNLQGKGAWSPVWTPDGSTVVFMSNMRGQLDTWMINNDGTGLQQLTFDSRMMPRALGVTP